MRIAVRQHYKKNRCEVYDPERSRTGWFKWKVDIYTHAWILKGSFNFDIIAGMAVENQVEKPIVLSLLEKTVNILDSHKLPYYIVGSLGASAITGSEIYRRYDGTDKDLDILTPNPQEVGEVLKQEGLLKVNPQDRKVDLGINRNVDLTEVDNPRLRYKSIDIPLSKDIFVANQVQLDGIAFPTIPAETLFHFYALSTSLRRDDWSNALVLGRWIRKQPSSSLQEEHYGGFHKYNKLRQKMYPLQALMWRLDKKRNVEGKNSIVNLIKEKIPWSVPLLAKSRNMLNTFIDKVT